MNRNRLNLHLEHTRDAATHNVVNSGRSFLQSPGCSQAGRKHERELCKRTCSGVAISHTFGQFKIPHTRTNREPKTKQDQSETIFERQHNGVHRFSVKDSMSFDTTEHRMSISSCVKNMRQLCVNLCEIVIVKGDPLIDQ